MTIEDLNKRPGVKAQVVPDVDGLNRVVAQELAGALESAIQAGRQLVVIVPVGPLDYKWWADEINRRELDGSALVTINMDEYLTDGDEWIAPDHPMSFRRYMSEGLFDRLRGKSRMPEENRIFPDPRNPRRVTELLERHGGADICYAGIGLSGHLAFNDPPAGRDCVTRVVDLLEVTRAQVCLSGTDGVWELIPHRAVTVGMREILGSRYVHLTLLRNWHAGLWRRAFSGPVTEDFPASFLQEHPNLRVTATRLAASEPALHAALRV